MQIPGFGPFSVKTPKCYTCGLHYIRYNGRLFSHRCTNGKYYKRNRLGKICNDPNAALQNLHPNRGIERGLEDDTRRALMNLTVANRSYIEATREPPPYRCECSSLPCICRPAEWSPPPTRPEGARTGDVQVAQVNIRPSALDDVLAWYERMQRERGRERG